jgi:hypothetical protein
MTRLLIILLFLALPLSAPAKIYRTVDEQGNVVFTDEPPPAGAESEEVTLPQINTTPPPEPRPDLAPEPNEPAEEPAATEYGVAITDPSDETTIPMGPGNFTVSGVVRPSLGSGHKVQLFMDGVAQGDPQTTPSWQLTNVFRGAHDLTIAVIDGEGNQLAVSDPVRVYVLRPSVNYPNRK